MKINELNTLAIGEAVGEEIEVLAKVNNIKLRKKKNGEEFILLELMDNTDIITFPVWKKVGERKISLNVGQTIKVQGKIGYYEGKLQIDEPTFYKVSDAEMEYDLLPKYEITEELIRYFENVIENLGEKYKKIAIASTGVFEYNKDRWEAFTHCVSAEKNYGNKIGGLFLHTCGVLKSVESMIKNYSTNPFNININATKVINKDRLLLKAIIHDLGKIEVFEYKNNIKRKESRMSHIEFGASYVNDINNELGKVLDKDELIDIQYSILAQYGEFGKYEAVTIEDKLLHYADMIDSQIAIEGNKS